MNTGFIVTMAQIRGFLDQMDKHLESGKKEEAREALLAAQREAGILKEMLDTVLSAWPVVSGDSN